MVYNHNVKLLLKYKHFTCNGLEGGRFVGKSIFDLEVGDILSIYDRDYIVEQVYKIGNGPAAKLNCLLKDGSETRWFGARDDDGITMMLGEELHVDFNQADNNITIDSENFKKVGTAQGRAVGTSDLGYPRYINMEYFDFVSDEGSKYLFIQKGDNRTVAFCGERVINSAVLVFPNPNK